MNAAIDYSALREKLCPDTSPSSEAVTPTPLSTYLYLLTHCEREGYKDYMQGARDLWKWLQPIDMQENLYPEVLSNLTVPDVLYSYELLELAKIMTQDVKDFGAKLIAMSYACKIIYLTSVYNRR